jgi:hypothetical protein
LARTTRDNLSADLYGRTRQEIGFATGIGKAPVRCSRYATRQAADPAKRTARKDLSTSSAKGSRPEVVP